MRRENHHTQSSSFSNSSSKKNTNMNYPYIQLLIVLLVPSLFGIYEYTTRLGLFPLSSSSSYPNNINIMDASSSSSSRRASNAGGVDRSNNDKKKDNSYDIFANIKDVIPPLSSHDDQKNYADLTKKYPLKEVACFKKNNVPIIMHERGTIIKWVCSNSGEKQVTKVMLEVFREYEQYTKYADIIYPPSRDGGSSTVNSKKSPPPPRSIMLDIGANAGYYGYLAASYGLPVVAFDLQPECHDIIQSSILTNNFTNLMRVVPKGVSEGQSTTIEVHETGCDGRFPFNVGVDDTQIKNNSTLRQVELHPLDYYLPPNNDESNNEDGNVQQLEILMMKVDTEGNEKRVLAGAMRFFETQQIKNAIVEVTPGYGFWDKAGISEKEVTETFMKIIDECDYAMVSLGSVTKDRPRRFFKDGKKAVDYILGPESRNQLDVWFLPKQDLKKRGFGV